MEEVDFVKALFHNCSEIGMAARQGNIDQLKSLISEGKDYCISDNRGWFPIHESASNGHTECVKELVRVAKENNENPYEIWQNPFNPFDGTAFIMACRGGFLNIIQILAPLCDPNSKEAADALFESTKYINCLSFLLKGFPNLVNGSVKYNVQAPIFNAVSNCCVDSVRFLISQNANLQVQDEFGRSPLHCAVSILNESQRKEMVEILLSHNCCVDAKDSEGYTSLFLAAQNNSLQTVKLLLEYDANPNIYVNIDLKVSKPIKVCPIGIATENNCVEVVRLLAKLTDIQKMGKDGVLSPIIEAITNYNPECLSILVENEYCLSGLLPYCCSSDLPNEIYCKNEIINNMLPWEFNDAGYLYNILKFLIDNRIFLTKKFASNDVFIALVSSPDLESVSVFKLVAEYGYMELFALYSIKNYLLDSLKDQHSSNNLCKINPKIKLLLFYLYGCPLSRPVPSLKHITRLFIRSYIFSLKEMLHDIKKLPLPPTVISFLMLEDIF